MQPVVRVRVRISGSGSGSGSGYKVRLWVRVKVIGLGHKGYGCGTREPGVQCHSASFATVSGPETKVTLLYEPLMFWSRRDASGLRVPMREYRQRP